MATGQTSFGTCLPLRWWQVATIVDDGWQNASVLTVSGATSAAFLHVPIQRRPVPTAEANPLDRQWKFHSSSQFEGCRDNPRRLVTDGLRSYGVAQRAVWTGRSASNE
jgi:hypothetical protein